jgi:hypothetical protein
MVNLLTCLAYVSFSNPKTTFILAGKSILTVVLNKSYFK